MFARSGATTGQQPLFEIGLQNPATSLRDMDDGWPLAFGYEPFQRPADVAAASS